MASRSKPASAVSILNRLGQANRLALPQQLFRFSPRCLANRESRSISSSFLQLSSPAIRSIMNQVDPRASSGPSQVSQDLRGLMRQLGYPVTILTLSLGAHQPHGATISSFTSIAMDPEPLVSFSIRLPSRLANHLANHPHSRFSIYLLEPEPRPTALAKLFSRPKDRFGTEVFEELEQVCMGRLDCELFKEIALHMDDRTAGSTLFIGRVLKALNLSKGAKPLMYHNQRFTTIETDHAHDSSFD